MEKRLVRFWQNWILPDLAMLFFCLLLLGLVWGTAAFQVQRDRQAAIEAVMRDGDKFSRAFEEHTRQVLKTSEQYIALVKDEYEGARAVTPALHRLFNLIAQDPLAVQLALVDAKGDMLASLRQYADDFNFSQEPHFLVHLTADTDSLFIGRPFTGRVSGRPSIPLSRRLNNPDGSFAGIAYAAVNPQYFTRFYRDMDFDEQYVVRVLGLDGFVRASNNEQETGANLQSATVFGRLDRARSGFYRTNGQIFGTIYLMSYRQMPDYPLIVQVGLSEAAFIPLAQRRFTYFGAAGGVSLFILLYTGRLMARSRRQRQIEARLQGSYQDLASAHADVTVAQEGLREHMAVVVAHEEEIRKQNAVLASLHQMALGLMHRLELAEVLTSIVGSATELLETPHGYIGLIDEERGLFDRMIGLGYYAPDVGRQIMLDGSSLVGLVYRSGEMVVVDDYSVWEHRINDSFFDELHNLVQVPLKSGGQVIGIFGLAILSEERKFTAREIDLIGRFAELASLALSNAKLYSSLAAADEKLQASYQDITAAHEELSATETELRTQYLESLWMNEQISRQKSFLTTLQEITFGLVNELELEPLLQNVVTTAADVVEAKDAFIALPSDDYTVLEVRAHLGIYGGADGVQEVPLGWGVMGKVFSGGQPELVDDYQAWEGRAQIPLVDAIASVFAVPLKAKEEVIGVLGVALTTPGKRFAPEQLKLLERLAELAALALNNARLHARLKHELEERIELESQKAAMLDAIPDLMLIFDQDGVLRDYEKPADFVFYVEPDQEVIGRNVTDLLPAPIAANFSRFIKKAIVSDTTQLYEYRMTIHGEICYREVRFSRLSDTKVLAMIRDITGIRRSEEQVEFLSMHDRLTGTYNRTYFEEELLRLQNRGHKGIGVFVCDVDGLKLINDTLGHRHGDELLKSVAAILTDNISPPDFVARIGGDEFAVVLFEPTDERMGTLEKQYKAAVDQYIEQNPQLPLSLSLGWATDLEAVRIDKVFKEADNSMYRQKMHQSQSIRSAIVHTMMKALEARDHITEGHADRLGELMEKMGHRLQLSQGTVADLRLLAKFHDIGKVGIPDGILKKPGKLTAEEISIMRQHCEIGFRIARSAPDLEPISDWILKHQEHWDGNGYPLGLRGEEIPLECRIVGIVDAYDAMTSDRPYRQAMHPKDAIKEIRRCAGSQFDPVLAEKFIEMIEMEMG
ncbi:MAG: diguanylate cyclase [Negativicutes bacterium]|nr:diguanylate cyclase [Negativicutes bacterium]